MEAQRYCETLYQAIIVVFSVVGFISGYFLESFRITVYAVFAGVALASALCVPDWGIFKGKEEAQWLPEGCTKRPARGAAAKEGGESAENKKKN